MAAWYSALVTQAISVLVFAGSSALIAYVAAGSALRRWSSGTYVTGARRVGLAFISLALGLVCTALWLAISLFFPYPAAALATVLSPIAIPDFDIAAIIFIELQWFGGAVLFFGLFPLVYFAMTARPLPQPVRWLSVPLLVAAACAVTMGINQSASNVLRGAQFFLVTLGLLAAFWFGYLFAMDKLAAPTGR